MSALKVKPSNPTMQITATAREMTKISKKVLDKTQRQEIAHNCILALAVSAKS